MAVGSPCRDIEKPPPPMARMWVVMAHSLGNDSGGLRRKGSAPCSKSGGCRRYGTVPARSGLSQLGENSDRHHPDLTSPNRLNRQPDMATVA